MREKERERARARARGEDSVSPTIAGELRAPVRIDLASSSPTTAKTARAPAPVRDSKLQLQSENAIDGAISRRRDRGLEIAIERARALSLSLSFSGNPLKVK